MLKAILFDMDGTITRPNIDWKDLRARVGVPEGVPIMAHIDSLPRAEAETGDCTMLAPALLRCPNRSPVSQLAASLASRPLASPS